MHEQDHAAAVFMITKNQGTLPADNHNDLAKVAPLELTSPTSPNALFVL